MSARTVTASSVLPLPADAVRELLIRPAWTHRVRVVSVDAATAFHRDEVLVDAGVLTPVATPLVRGLFRWRHRRWRRLAAAWRAR